MNEDFLHFVWKHNLFDNKKLKTTDGQKLEIISVGSHNFDSGPDFFNAKIKIGDTLWAGNVEIHQKASDWYLHKHQLDDAYNNVILHVVLDNDKPIEIKGKLLPCLILNYPEKVLSNFQNLLASKHWIACQEHFHLIDPFQMKFWSTSLLIERLQSKTSEIKRSLDQNQNNWNETFYQLLAKNFGMKTNSLPFEMLAKQTPLTILSKHKNNLFQIEAILFGQSGLLNEELIGDDYFIKLRDEYSFLRKKYQLKAIDAYLWKFMRLRPANFPTIKISQFAKLIYKSTALFSKITETENISDLQKLFDVDCSDYWSNHYRFNKVSKIKSKNLGKSSFYNIVINTIAPALFIYGELNGKQMLKDRAISLLESVPAEKNHIIKKWEEMGLAPSSAFETQALIQLKNVYCENKKCLNCQVGIKIISQTKEFKHE